jgi:hypothetical protein
MAASRVATQEKLRILKFRQVRRTFEIKPESTDASSANLIDNRSRKRRLPALPRTEQCDDRKLVQIAFDRC